MSSAQTSNEASLEKYALVEDFSQLFKKAEATSESLSSSLSALYTWASQLTQRPDDLPDKFISNHDETVWQQILHRNNQIGKEYRKGKSLLDEDLESAVGVDEYSSDENSENEDEMEMDDEEMSEMDDEEEEECDLFNLKAEDLKDLERQLEEGDSDDEEEGEEKPQKKFPKSPVDDKFFSLAEMDAFCDEADKNQEEESFLTTVDDDWGGATSYKYEDFFGKMNDVEEGNAGAKDRKRKATDDGGNKRRKSVRFADDVEDEHADEDGTTEQPEAGDSEGDEEGEGEMDERVLLGENADEQTKETNLKRSLNKLKDTISKLEAENLEARSWQLSGEVTGQGREENALLETHLQFDQGTKKAPEITEDFTDKLEAIIIQRIKDSAFDNVVRQKRENERATAYRNEAIEEREMVKKALTDVYEKEYQQKAEGGETEEKVNEEHVEIERRMNELFRMIDALSHFEYTPPEVRPEVRVVSNMAALRVEEVGMEASTDAQLLAPEEMKKRQKGDLKADDERDVTDKLRQRRKKKNKQRAMVTVLGKEKAFAGKEESTKKKKKATKEGGNENLKSANFFTQLQDTVRKELKEKTSRKKKIVSEKTTSGGAKFKL